MHELVAPPSPNHPIASRRGGLLYAQVTTATMVLGGESYALAGIGFFKRGFVPAGLISAVRRSGTRAE
ncbi:hypothetical protein IWX81_001899 [Salinibacterium sp. CAN_S4]|uniref:hypothetical protein n=1 Tax=Salinibacterium sp. CAN_S4 TaxID=2787727 RepID=UPI0018EFD301